MEKRYVGSYSYLTDQGKVRINNEDQAMVKVNDRGEVFLVVADGMGGQNKGDYASKVALDSLMQDFDEKRCKSVLFSWLWLRKAISKANKEIFDTAENEPKYKDMGTTLVAVLIIGEKMIIANVGDSRAYAFSDAGVTHLTEDQTLVEYLFRTGKISKEETSSRDDRHVLMNALGIYPSAAIDMRVRPYMGEAILLCSDGLYNNVSEMEIKAVLSTDERVETKVRALIDEANGNGGSDNVAVAYWECVR